MLTAKRPTPRQGNVGRPRPRSRHVLRSLPFSCDDAVSPVVGTSLILVITVLGMAGVLFWGTPTLQGIQDRGSVVGMEGEFDELRRASLELSVPDASRVPTVVMEDGTLNLQDGTRVMVAVAMDPDVINVGCDFFVTGWEDSPSATITVDLTGCRDAGASLSGNCLGSVCLDVHRVTGSSTIEQTDLFWVPVGTNQYQATYTGSGTAPNFASGDWLVRLSSSSSTTTYAEAWVMEQKRITWSLSTSVSDVQLHLEGGAIFEVEEGAYFLHRPPAIREDAFGSEDYVLRLVTLLGADSGSAGRSTPEVFMGLVGNHVRTSTDGATQVRYAFHGDIAEAWCRSLLLRNDGLVTGTQPTREYAPVTSCDDTTPSVVFTVVDSGTAAARETFPFEFLHARVTSSIRA